MSNGIFLILPIILSTLRVFPYRPFFSPPFWPVCISISIFWLQVTKMPLFYFSLYIFLFLINHMHARKFFLLHVSLIPCVPFPLLFLFFCLCDFMFYCLAKIESRLHVLRYSLVKAEKRVNRMYKKICL